MNLPQKLLFICSRNRWRSLTAEHLLQGHPRYSVKSAGTESGARIRVNAGHLGWADLIFVMEKKHAQILHQKFAETLTGKPIICLHIPDEFEYMHPELVDILKTSLSEHLDLD